MAGTDGDRLSALTRQTRARIRVLTLTIYAAGTLWLVAVAGIIAAAAGVRAGFWLALPASIVAAVLSSRARSPFPRSVDGIGGRHALPVIADSIPTLMVADWPRTRSALLRLVPTLLEPDGPTLNERQWDGLVRALAACDVERDSELMRRLLEAIGSVGRTRLLSEVERYATGPASQGPEAEVRRTATAALAALRDRAQRERETGLLLRPAEPADDPGQVLLRPAHGVSSQDSGTLVRPAEPDAHPPSSDGCATVADQEEGTKPNRGDHHI